MLGLDARVQSHSGKAVRFGTMPQNRRLRGSARALGWCPRTRLTPPPHLPSPGGSASATSPRGGSDSGVKTGNILNTINPERGRPPLGARASRPHLIPANNLPSRAAPLQSAPNPRLQGFLPSCQALCGRDARAPRKIYPWVYAYGQVLPPLGGSSGTPGREPGVVWILRCPSRVGGDLGASFRNAWLLQNDAKHDTHSLHSSQECNLW